MRSWFHFFIQIESTGMMVLCFIQNQIKPFSLVHCGFVVGGFYVVVWGLFPKREVITWKLDLVKVSKCMISVIQKSSYGLSPFLFHDECLKSGDGSILFLLK